MASWSTSSSWRCPGFQITLLFSLRNIRRPSRNRLVMDLAQALLAACQLLGYNESSFLRAACPSCQPCVETAGSCLRRSLDVPTARTSRRTRAGVCLVTYSAEAGPTSDLYQDRTMAPDRVSAWD